MNIAESPRSSTEVSPVTTEIYINIDFALLANDINNGTVIPQYNGKGRKMALLSEQEESTYLFYSSDAQGTQRIDPPFTIQNGDNITFNLQANQCSEAKFKWKGIIQNYYNLQLVEGTKSTYNADMAAQVNLDDTDEVTITVNFKLNKEQYSMTWDPKVIIIR